ncbi:chaperone NapD [Magnetovibrio sp.]|uniref:chaperone NapD n=1 Tax=Magnetovibrio sp. TaxID=2024836 RepID=UPI002F95E0BA
MSITGLVIHAVPENAASVQAAVEALDGAEVHKVTEDGRLVVTVDNPDDGKAAQVFDSFRTIAGVLSASLVYTHFEEDHGEGEHVS